MEKIRAHENLSGKGILLVMFPEVPLTKEYQRYCEEVEKMRVFVIFGLPSWGITLLQYMDEKNIDVAVMHDIVYSNFDQIIEATKAGKKIAVQTKDRDVIDLGMLYEKLRKNDILCIQKGSPSYMESFKTALDFLSAKIKQDGEI